MGGSPRARTQLVLTVLMLGVGLRPLVVGQGGDIDETREERAAVLPLPIVEQLIDEALPAAAAMHEHVLEGDQLVQMRAHLEVRPARQLADAAIREAVIRPLHRQARALGCDLHLSRFNLFWAGVIVSLQMSHPLLID